MSQQQVSFKTYGGSAPENYEKYFVPAIGRPLATDLVEVAALRPAERVLDVACGTGVLARLARDRVGPTGMVAGVDINPGMLAVARTTTPPDLAIEWYQAGAEDLPLPDEAFDVVVCQLGLQFFPDRPTALREARRVLVPGGRLVVNLPGPRPGLFAVMEEALARHLTPEAGAFVGSVFSLHDAGEIQDLIGEAAFNDVKVRSITKTLRLPAPADFLWQYVHSTPLAGAAAGLDSEGRAALERDVVAGWRPFTEDGGLTLKLEVATATGRK